MLRDILLGLLRDGSAPHGYELVVRYQRVTGADISPGSVYRDLAALERAGCIERRLRAHHDDERRIPYVITDRGRQVFDRWLRTPRDGDHMAHVAFLELLPPAERARFVDAWRTTIAARSLHAARSVADARSDHSGFSPCAALLAHRLRLLRAENELIDDVCRGLERASDTVVPANVRRLAVG